MYKYMVCKIWPETRREFKNNVSEQFYLFEKVSYWLHVAGKRENCRRYIGRLNEIVPHTKMDTISILKYSILAVVAEYERKWDVGIDHRRTEVGLIIRLIRSFTADCREEVREYALQNSKPRQVVMYLNLIKQTYQAAGQDQAVKILAELQKDVRETQKHLDELKRIQRVGK